MSFYVVVRALWDGYLEGNQLMSGVGEGGYVVWVSVDRVRCLERVDFVYDTNITGGLSSFGRACNNSMYYFHVFTT